MFLIDLCSPFVKHPHISPVLSRSWSPKGRSITWGFNYLHVVLFRCLFVKWLTPEMCIFSMFHFGHILFSVVWTAEKGKVLQKVIPLQNDNFWWRIRWHTFSSSLARVLRNPHSTQNKPLSLIFPTSVQLAWLHPNKCFSTLPTIDRGC